MIYFYSLFCKCIRRCIPAEFPNEYISIYIVLHCVAKVREPEYMGDLLLSNRIL